jgi:hypothetical protein
MMTRRWGPKEYFGVRFVDAATGRGVPLVEAETVHRVGFVSDGAGWVAIGDPGLMGGEVFFHVRSHGYDVPKDGFGYAGVRLTPKPGGRATVKLRRINVAERLCRLTGEGIYADSVLLGERPPTREPLLSGRVYGQDSALAVVHRGKMLWFWGDTNRPNYPLGNFRTTGAVATLPAGRKTADDGLDFRYFTGPDGFAREMCPTDKPGPVWVSGLVAVGEGDASTVLARYARMKDLGTVLEQGYVEWDDAKQVFRYAKEIPVAEKWRFLDGHPIRLREGSETWLAGGFTFPLVRVRESREKVYDRTAYEAFTCRLPNGDIRRDAGGKPVYEWQRDAPPISPGDEDELVKAGKLRPEEARFLPATADGRRIVLHGGSVTWNPWRERWLCVATARGEKESYLGEVYYAEAESPTGPWRRAVKLLTHDRYSFYNPVHHPFLDADGGRIIYFEGTYTETFSGNPRPTPRYDYNQILYRLDLADGRLAEGRSQ